jgi:hypothetical protein
MFLYFLLILHHILSNFAFGTIFFRATVDFLFSILVPPFCIFFFEKIFNKKSTVAQLRKIWFQRKSCLEFDKESGKNIKTWG